MGIPQAICHNLVIPLFLIIRMITLFLRRTHTVTIAINIQSQELKKFPKVHWSRTSEHQKSTGLEQFSTGPEHRNGGNKICWTQN